MRSIQRKIRRDLPVTELPIEGVPCGNSVPIAGAISACRIGITFSDYQKIPTQRPEPKESDTNCYVPTISLTELHETYSSSTSCGSLRTARERIQRRFGVGEKHGDTGEVYLIVVNRHLLLTSGCGYIG
jgi:hypothetical protein